MPPQAEEAPMSYKKRLLKNHFQCTNLQKSVIESAFMIHCFRGLRKKYCLQVFYNDVNSVLIGHD